MATIRQHFEADDFEFRSTAFPQRVKVDGTSIPQVGLAFDASTVESAYRRTRAINYGSGNLTFTIGWYADTATAGDVVWGVSIAAVTPNADTQDVETKALATANTFTDGHLGTTGQRGHDAIVPVSNLDSLAADDWLNVRVYRDASNAADTMSGDAILTMVDLAYSDSA
jgi:hypothetical protein